jgi:Fic family protein
MVVEIRMSFDREKPFNDLPQLPPTVELETNAVLKRCIAARSALAELKGVGDTIPNQALLIRSIGLQEARSSSEIENIVTTTDDLYQALADSIDQTSPSTKEVLRYQEALQAGLRALKERPILSVSLFCDLASRIKQCDMTIRTMPGTRIEANAGIIVYTPPEGESVVREKLRNLEEYLNLDSDVDPLIKLAVMHYQFEAIHPFTDGNGRTGRILNVLYLVQQNLIRLPVLYLSKYFIENKTDYYSGLRMVTEDGNWQNWILYILKGIETTANETRAKIIQIRSLMDDTQSEVKEKLPKVYSKDLVELLFEYPYCKRQFLVDRGICSVNTASSYLKSLESIGILTSIKYGREVYYLNKALLNLLKA